MQNETKEPETNDAVSCRVDLLVIRQAQSDAINDCINTAVGICNMSDDNHVTEMAAHIADQLIAHFTDVPDL